MIADRTHRIDVDELVVPEILKLTEERRKWEYPVNEDMVSRCLDPAVGFQDDVDWIHSIIALCRTSILHVVHAHETTNVILSAGDYPLPELPRLPFPRVAIETLESQGWLVGTTDGKKTWGVYAVFISERREGEIWDCCWYWCRDDKPYDDGIPFLWWSIHATPDGIKVHDTYDNPLEPDHAEELRALATFAIELAQIIGADKVPHEPVGFLSRQQRRQWQSKHPYIIMTDKPRVYFVNLHEAGETDHKDGDGSRVYHCRWLVRGHWRHYAGGKTKDGKRTFTKKTSWVKAHVRGPVGAPWKGRPIYRESSSDD